MDSVVCKCGTVPANDGGLVQSAHANENWCRGVNVCLVWQSWTRESEVSIPKCSNCGKTGRPKAMCRQREKSAGKSSPRAAVARVLAKAARAVETQTSAIVVDTSVIDDQIVLVETKVAGLCGKRGHLRQECLSSGRNASARAVEVETVEPA